MKCGGVLMSLPSDLSKEKAFWLWVEEKQETFLSFIDEKPDEDLSILDEVKDRLQVISEDLTFEIGIDEEDRTIEFVLSAGGLLENMPFVDSLAESFPNFANWTLIKYKQPKDDEDVLVDGKKYTADKIFFDLDEENKLVLYFKNFKNRDYENYLVAGLTLLDYLLGEYIAMTSFSAIVCMPIEKKSEKSRPLTELPLVFED